MSAIIKLMKATNYAIRIPSVFMSNKLMSYLLLLLLKFRLFRFKK